MKKRNRTVIALWLAILLTVAIAVGASVTMDFTGKVAAQVIPTPYWSDYYGLTTTFDGQPIAIGQVVTAYDPSGVLCGETTVITTGQYGLMSIYGDDPMSGVDEGAVGGDTLAFRIDGYLADTIEEVIWYGGFGLYEVDLSASGEPAPTPTEEGIGIITGKDDRYELALPDSTEKIELRTGAEVGMRLYRWGEECYIDVSMPFAATTITAVEDNKIKLASSSSELNLYGVAADDLFEDGSVEFEIILKERPLSNLLTFDLDMRGLTVHYQPPLTEEFENGWNEELRKNIVVTETEVRDAETGDLYFQRPENIVNSYALYNSANQGHVAGQTDYKAGKAFHITRPQLEDVNEKTCWAALHISENHATVTIPWDFLNTAVYPVRHAAGFTVGNSGAGASQGTNNNQYHATQFTSPADAGTADTLHCRVKQYGAHVPDLIFFIYSDNGSTYPDSKLDDTAPWTVTASYDGEKVLAVNTGTAIAGSTLYWLGVHSNDASSEYFYYRWDADGVGKYKDNADATPAATFPVGAGGHTRKWTVWCTYSAAAVGAQVIIVNIN